MPRRRAAVQRRPLQGTARQASLRCRADGAHSGSSEPAGGRASGEPSCGDSGGPLWQTVLRQAGSAALVLGVLAVSLCRPPLARARCGCRSSGQESQRSVAVCIPPAALRTSLRAGPYLLTCTPLFWALTSLPAVVPRPPAGPSGGVASEVSPAAWYEWQPHEPSSSSQQHAGEQEAASTSSQWYAGEQDAARSRRGARDTGIRVAAVPEEEAYHPTKEEFKRAVERSGIPESQKRKLLGVRLPRHSHSMLCQALVAPGQVAGAGAALQTWHCTTRCLVHIICTGRRLLSMSGGCAQPRRGRAARWMCASRPFQTRRSGTSRRSKRRRRPGART